MGHKYTKELFARLNGRRILNNKGENMAVANKLETLLESDRQASLDYFIMNEDFSELSNLITAPLKTLKLPFVVGKAGFKLVSKTAKTIDKLVDKLDLSGFKKSIGAKDLKDIDVNMSQIKVADDEFRPLLIGLYDKLKRSKKRNKELYDALKPIYEKHKKREIEWYERRLKIAVKNDNFEDQETYYNAIVAMVNEVEKDSPLIDDITSAIANHHDLEDRLNYEKIYKKVEQDDGPKESRSKEELADVPITKMTDSELLKMLSVYTKSIEKGMEQMFTPSGKANLEAANLMAKWERLVKSIEKEAKNRGIEI